MRTAIATDREQRATAAEQAVVADRLALLTAREHEVLELLLTGKTSKEIATALNLSIRTVEGHRRMVLSKTRIPSTTQLVRAVLTLRPVKFSVEMWSR